MSLCYYITSHGLGHAVRSCAILNRIPSNLPVLIRSAVPIEFFRQELTRSFQYEPAIFDCGAVQRDGLTVDPVRTLDIYSEIHLRNQQSLGAEVELLRAHGVRVVASDAPSFPLKVASLANLPSFVVSNFTWADIYEPYVAQAPEYTPLLEEIRAEYRCATGCLRLPLSLPMSDVPNHRDVGLVCRRPEPIRESLARHYGLDLQKRWILVYIGQWPSDFDYGRLTRLPDIAVMQLGTSTTNGRSVVAVDPHLFRGQDVVAACDVVIAKPGYGISADCIAGDTPMLYTRRDDFAEFAAIYEGLTQWGRAICLDAEIFLYGDLGEHLDRVAQLTQRRSFSLAGADEVAAALLEAGGWSHRNEPK